MPDFDYKSFMAGLQVGRRIRLWDASANKPPMPPTPSGRYILTESGEKVLTELSVAWDSVSVFNTGEWYPLVEPLVVGGITYTEARQNTIVYDGSEVLLADDAKFIYAELQTGYSYPGQAVLYWIGLTETPASARDTVDLRNPVTGSEYLGYVSGRSRYLSGEIYTSGNVKYWISSGLNLSSPSSLDRFIGSWTLRTQELHWFYPDGATTFEGTRTDLDNVFAHLISRPLITEGG